MKKLIIAALLGIVSVSVKSQPKTYTRLDTTVSQVTDYKPDTISVFFKELIINDTQITEKWSKGYVIWQTYIKRPVGAFTNGSAFTYSDPGINALYETPYYTNEFRQSVQYIENKFLYADRKTIVKNKVIQTLKP